MCFNLLLLYKVHTLSVYAQEIKFERSTVPFELNLSDESATEYWFDGCLRWTIVVNTNLHSSAITHSLLTNHSAQSFEWKKSCAISLKRMDTDIRMAKAHDALAAYATICLKPVAFKRIWFRFHILHSLAPMTRTRWESARSHENRC